LRIRNDHTWFGVKVVLAAINLRLPALKKIFSGRSCRLPRRSCFTLDISHLENTVGDLPTIVADRHKYGGWELTLKVLLGDVLKNPYLLGLRKGYREG